MKMTLKDDDQNWLEENIQKVKDFFNTQNPVDKDDLENAKSLAKISKRREELKEKLEGGQLKADEASSVGIEYKILKKAYKELIDKLKTKL